MSDKPRSDTDHAVPTAALVQLSSWGPSSVSVSNISCKTSAHSCSKNDGINSYRKKFLLPRWIPLEFVSLSGHRGFDEWQNAMSRVGLIIDAFSYGEKWVRWGIILLEMWILFSKMILEGLNFCHYDLVLFHLSLQNTYSIFWDLTWYFLKCQFVPTLKTSFAAFTETPNPPAPCLCSEASITHFGCSQCRCLLYC